MHPLRVVGVRVELPANQPVVLLREQDGARYLPIWIGAVEASAIAFQQQGVQTVRPLTHDLLRDVISGLGADLESVHITEMREDIFYAELRFKGGVNVSARPSDAIALALRCDVGIFGSDEVLDAAGIERNPDYEAQGGFSFASGLVAGKKLLSLENRPTAIFASNDDMAAAVVQMAHDHKLSVPGDITVVGFDDSSIASMVSPQITTVRQPIFEMARGAADMLLNHIENGQISPARKIDYKLIIRQSAGKAPV